MSRKRSRLKPKHLESYLQQLKGFESPDVALEQYQTPPEIAAQMLWLINEHRTGIEGKTVLDLGCGTGTLAIGCVMLGAEKVVGVDVDQTALDAAVENVADMELPDGSISFLNKDIRELSDDDFEAGIHFDTVVMNPPFGTRAQVGIDAIFVQKALSLANTVYSLHKTSTRDFWVKDKGTLVSVEVVSEISFNLDASYGFHQKKSHNIKVDLFQFTKR